MANDNLCVFCGQKMGFFQASGISCAGVYQHACRDCARELNDLSEDEQCRRALRLGLANEPEKLEKHIDIFTKAEEHRPSCLRCGTKLRFRPVQLLDNTPLGNSIFNDTFAVLPAFCENCGKYEFYDPDITGKNPFLAYLIKKDKAE